MTALGRMALLLIAASLLQCNLTPTERLLNQADDLYEDGDLERAAQRYSRVLDPGRVSAYYAIGIAHYNARDYANAVRWLRRYLDLAPKAEDREKVEQLIHSLREWSGDVSQARVFRTA